ncbi:MAG: 2,3-bisphosphoglycerate-independent phosphoglycerate mutase [Lachnospiraceae bacterium]|nr:2,3-bisphosphoglycerate-independent phosphoglycerate mutase [Lachnospiraceae bacterium]
MKQLKYIPTVLMILDGFGLSSEKIGNAQYLANMPNIDRLYTDYPNSTLSASGLDVGLPDGQMGNSEVGHLNIGAGRIVYQDLTKITKAIQDGDFFENPELIRAIDNAKEKGTALHLWGLLSDGGVHSHILHVAALVEMAKRRGLGRVFIHAFLDGRDTPPTSGITYLQQLQSVCEKLKCGTIATLSGRYYAMDRDKRWERVERAYKALTDGNEAIVSIDLAKSLQESYDKGVTDEFVEPTVLVDRSCRPVGRVHDGDSIIFFNFRPDRAREITRAFVDDAFDGFEREKLQDLTYVCFTEYDATMPNVTIAFPKTAPENTLGQYIAGLGYHQLRLAETEKYAHVTFFFNGGIEAPNENEDRILVPSPKVATYDLQPEMSAYQVRDELVKAILEQKHELIIINFANPDMVGHTGVLEAAVKAVEAVDTCVGDAVNAVLQVNGQMLIIADHGNCETMIEPDGSPMTAHTTNPVPVILISNNERRGLMSGGRLCDVSPTLLDMMGLPQPEEMTGHSLLIK